jgi:integrase
MQLDVVHPLIILTASRSSEVCDMCLDEVDFDAATWTVRAERMKAGREHVVPLSSAALALPRRLEAIPPRHHDFIFSGAAKGSPIKNQKRLAAHGEAH